MALGTLSAISLGLGTAGALARGVGGAVAAKKSFSDEQQKELDKLLRLRASGNLGLSQKEQDRAEAQARSAQSGALRDAQATSLQSAAAQGASGAGVSGRDVFLRELAGQTAVQDAVRASSQALADADKMKKDEQKLRIQQLDAAKAASRVGVATALTGGAAGLLDVGAGALDAAAQREADLEIAKAQLPSKTIDELMVEVGAAENPYLRRLGAPMRPPRL
jgi:hypothetical protein